MNGSDTRTVAPSQPEPELESEPVEPVAPAVVAVVVTHDPGGWFEECLAGLAAQDYPSLSVLVIDTASAEDPTARVNALLPDAPVHRLDHNPGFGAAANSVTDLVDGAAFYVFCHDDVALAPDAVRLLVEEAFRSNAGVVGPKLVDWDDPRRLLQVGLDVDKTGAPSAIVERGELDQEQHDALRDVFAIPGACTVIRADLFSALAGFDPEIELLGEDLDFCWRAQVAGARVMVVPSAVGRHREALDQRHPSDRRRQLATRYRLRTVLTCYSLWHLVRVVPQAALVTVVEVVYCLLAGRVRQAGDLVSAWTWNLGRLGDIRQRRAEVGRLRQVPDREVRRLQVGGSARFGAYLHGQIGRGDDRLRTMSTAGRSLAGSLRSGAGRAGAIVWFAVVAVLLLGSRKLLLDGVPAIGDLPRLPGSPWSLFGEWFSGWRSAGLGSEDPAPTAYGLLGLGGVGVLGQMGLLRTLMVVGMLPLGALGAWRLASPLGTRARLVALVVFVAIPLPYNAVASGRWGGLVLWAASPWILRRLLQASGTRPYGDGGSVLRQLIALGLLTAVVAAVVPFEVVVVLVVATAVVVGGLLAGEIAGAARTLAVAGGAVALATVLHLPWTAEILGAEWAAFGGVQGQARFDLAQLVRFETGPIGAAPFGYAAVIAAALPLVIARQWRLALATRVWAVALVCWSLAWMGEQDWSPVAPGPPEALLAPVAAGLALSVALGLVAFESDLPGYRFGWRQAVSAVAAVAVAVAAVPVLVAALDGRWSEPAHGFAGVLDSVETDATDAGAGAFRVLWMGDPDLLPVAGWELDDGLAYATTDGAIGEVQDRWPGSSDGPTRLIADSLAVAAERGTSRLGRLLAPMGIRYVMIPTALAPFEDGGSPVAAGLDAVLSEQLDLVAVDAGDNLTVYRNEAWAPVRTVLPPDVTELGDSDYLAKAAFTSIAGAPPVLPDEEGYGRWTGSLEGPASVYLADAGSSHWQVEVDGEDAPRRAAFGWANAFDADRGGSTEMRFDTPVLRHVLLGLQVALWLGAVTLLRAQRRRARTDEAVVEPADEGDALPASEDPGLTREPVGAR